MSVHAPSIAFDCASGSVLCNADGGGKYDNVNDLMTRIRRHLKIGELTPFSENPKASISAMSLQSSRGKVSHISLMVRRARINNRLDIDEKCNSRQCSGDFVPLCLDNVSGKGLTSVLCVLDQIAQDTSSKQQNPRSGLRRGYNKYWRGSIDIVHPDSPHLTRFVVVNEIPDMELMHAARSGELVDIQLRLKGIIYYDRFSSLAWGIEMIRAYDDSEEEEEEEEEEQQQQQQQEEEQEQREEEEEEEEDDHAVIARLRKERMELLNSLKTDLELSDDAIDDINERLVVLKREIRSLI